jgi:uncharacterized protein YjdB
MSAILRKSPFLFAFVLALVAVACGDTPRVFEPAKVVAVAVAPDAVALPVGESRVLRATPLDAAGRPLESRAVTWRSTDPTIATVAADGRITAVATGATTIVATSDGVSASARVTVEAPTPAPVDRIDVTPTAIVLEVGGARQLTAVVRDAAGNVLTGRTVAWSTDAPATVAVSAAGLVQALGPGYATIFATSEGKTVGIAATVGTPAVESVTLDRDVAAVAEGEGLTLVATPRDAAGRPVSGHPIAWLSSDASVATVSSDGRVEGVRAGTARVVARVQGRDAEATITVSGLPGLADDLAYDLSRGIGGVGPELYTLDLRVAGGAPRRVFQSGGTWDVTASPDGTKLAFTAAGLLVTEIVVANRDGSNARVVASGFGGQDQPAWSPDGTRIAFRRWAPGGPPGEFDPADIWVMNADGTAQQNLTADGDGAASMGSPAWSPRQPDGSYRIAYARRTRLRDDVGSSIHAMRADGTDKRALTMPGPRLDEEPAWAPNGTTVVFVRTGGSEDHDLWILDVASGEERPLFPARIPGAQRAPAWSPDGRLIAFTSSHEADARGAYYQVYTVWPDGSRLARRTFDGFDKERPAWIRRDQ